MAELAVEAGLSFILAVARACEEAADNKKMSEEFAEQWRREFRARPSLFSLFTKNSFQATRLPWCIFESDPYAFHPLLSTANTLLRARSSRIAVGTFAPTN